MRLAAYILLMVGCGGGTTGTASRPQPQMSDEAVSSAASSGEVSRTFEISERPPPARRQPSDQPYQFAAGRKHTCILIAGGRVACWGANDRGQMADGGGEPHRSASIIPDVRDAVALTAGSYHTCARIRDGRVSCWGANDRGQLGEGSTRSRIGAHFVHGLQDAVDVQAAASHTCARRRNGLVACWGYSFGESPRVISEVQAAEGLYVAEERACAVQRDGRVWCWGERDARAPYSAGTFGQGAEVVAARHDTCVRTLEEKVHCWSSSDSGPRAGAASGAVHIAGFDGSVELVASREFICGRLADGTVHCFGQNTCGLGGGNDVPARAGELVRVAGIDDARALFAGGGTACARRENGTVMCWGDRVETRYHDVAGLCAREPMRIPGVSEAVEIVGGDKHFCARRSDQQVLCWGRNDEGQLGDEAETFSMDTVEVRGIIDAAAISSGEEHTCVMQTGGSVSCWGANDWGQLGDGTYDARSVPVQVEGLGPVERIDAGVFHTCAQRRDGPIVCWGQSGETRSWLRPQALRGADSDLAELSAGRRTTCVRRAAGAIDCWQTLEANPLRLLVSDAFVEIDVSSDVCGVTAEGSVSCWSPTLNGTGWSGSRVVQRPQGAFIMNLALGSARSCVRYRDGQLGCWSGASLTPQNVAGVRNVASVRAFGAHVCSLDSDGSVVCWGAPYSQPPRWDQAVLIPMPARTRPVEIAVGARHACARIDSGEVRCWGNRAHGKLGDGATSTPDVPVFVRGLP